jgi:hypothetical protein
VHEVPREIDQEVARDNPGWAELDAAVDGGEPECWILDYQFHGIGRFGREQLRQATDPPGEGIATLASPVNLCRAGTDSHGQDVTGGAMQHTIGGIAQQ